MRDFTVIWGNIGDGHERRLDHVSVPEPVSFSSIMEEAKRMAYEDIDDMTFEEFSDLSYEGYTIFDGHVSESEFHFH